MAPRKKSQSRVLSSEFENLRGFSSTEAIGDDFDPEDLVNQAINADLDSSVFEALDERDIPRARNVFEFCTGRQFMNSTPFPRQIQILTHLFGDACYDCSDQDLLFDMYDQDLGEIQERIQFLHNGRCPKCGKTRLDFYKSNDWKFPQSAALLCGQRSGKNVTLVFAAHYQNHRFLTLERKGFRVTPSKYFGLTPTFLRMSFTAVTLEQATQNIWEQFVTNRNESPWYNEYHDFLRDAGKRMGVELLVSNATYTTYHHKSLGISCAVPDCRKLRGRTRYFTSVDEIAWFDSKIDAAQAKKLGDAGEVWQSLNNSLATIRNAATELFEGGDYDVPMGIAFDISSPSDINDIMCRTIRKSRNEPRILTGHYATWEFNPKYNKDSEFFRLEFAKNHDNALRDFGAIPPVANSPWMPDPKPVMAIVRQKADKQILSAEIKSNTDSFGQTTKWYKLGKVFDPHTPRIVAFDYGLNNNGFGCVLASMGGNNELRIDHCMYLKPEENEQINLSKMFKEFIYPLVTTQASVVVAFDQWNSVSDVQELRDAGVDARKYSLKPLDFITIKQDIINQRLSLPPSEENLNVFVNRSADDDLVEVSKYKSNFALVLQLLTVREISGKLLKPKYGDDDLFRAFCLAVFHAQDARVQQKLKSGGISGMRGSAGVAVSGSYVGGSLNPIATYQRYLAQMNPTAPKSRVGASGFRMPGNGRQYR
jgi:hypothetical protein